MDETKIIRRSSVYEVSPCFLLLRLDADVALFSLPACLPLSSVWCLVLLYVRRKVEVAPLFGCAYHHETDSDVFFPSLINRFTSFLRSFCSFPGFPSRKQSLSSSFSSLQEKQDFLSNSSFLFLVLSCSFFSMRCTNSFSGVFYV